MTRHDRLVGARYISPLPGAKSTLRQNDHTVILPILLILLAAFAVRMWHLNSESIWHDEGWSIRAFRGPFTTPDDNTPFVYYLAGHMLWRAGGGESPLALRYISVLIGTLTVALAVRIGWRWYDIKAGLTAGLLAASSPLLWEYSQEVRAYAAVPLVALALLAGAEVLLKSPPVRIRHAVSLRQHHAPIHRRAWLFMLVVELVGLYTHNLVVPLVVWLNVALGLVWLLRRDWQRMKTWMGMQTALVVCYIPWLLTQSPSGTPLNTPPEPGFKLVRDIWYSYFLPVLPQLQDALQNGGALTALVNIFGLVTISMGLFGLLFGEKVSAQGGRLPSPEFGGRTGDRGISGVKIWLLVSHTALVPIFTTVLMLAAHIDFHPRYYIAAVPGTLLLLVGGIVGATPSAKRRRPYGLPRLRRGVLSGHPDHAVLHVMIGVVGLLISILSLRQITTTRTYQHDDFRGLAEYYAALPGDAVILIPFDAERALQDYYAEALKIQAQIVNIPLYSDEQTTLEMLNALAADGVRLVELLTWFQLPADPRGMYPCLLAGMHTGGSVNAPRYFFGLSTQRFDIAPAEFRPLAFDPAYQAVMPEDAAYLSSRAATCLRTTWKLPQPASENVHVAAAVFNPIGDPIARSDAEIADDQNVGTSKWAAGAAGQAYNLLQLIPGAPLGDYTVTLSVYSAANPNGFDLLDESGAPAGKIYTLPETLRVAGPPLANAPDVPTLYSASADTITTGIPFDVTLLLPGGSFTVTLADTGWSLEQLMIYDQPGLAWFRFVVPPGSSGEAILRVGDVELARYPLVDIPRTFEMPAFDVPVGVEFPGVGTLAGVIVPETTVSPAHPPEVTLIWQAEGTAVLSYTVFVQMLSLDGRVIAQSDSPPASGARPTTSWVVGEYVMDTHTLRFNLTDYTGSAFLIAGLYDPDDFRRVTVPDGTDYVRIGITLTVR